MVTVNCDFYPTLLDAAGIDPDPSQPLDGVSIWEVLKDPTAKVKRAAIYWHYPLEKPHFLGGVSSGAILEGDLKLIDFFDSGQVALYDLSKDIGEKDNLAERFPEKVKELQQKRRRWLKGMRP